MRSSYFAGAFVALACVSGVAFAQNSSPSPLSRQAKIAAQEQLKSAQLRELQLAKQQAIAERRAANAAKTQRTNQDVAEATGENGQPAPLAARADRQARRQEILRRAQEIAQRPQVQALVQNLPPGVRQFIPPGLGQGGLVQNMGQFFPQGLGQGGFGQGIGQFIPTGLGQGFSQGIGQGLPPGLGQGMGQNWQALAQNFGQGFHQRLPSFGQRFGQGIGTSMAPSKSGLQIGSLGGRLRSR